MYIDVGIPTYEESGIPTYEESADTSICKEHKIVEAGPMADLENFEGGGRTFAGRLRSLVTYSNRR